MKSNNNLIVVLIMILIYEIALSFLKLDGLTITKIIFTIILWISAGIGVVSFFKNYTSIRKNIPKFALNILISIILWNLITITIGFNDTGSTATLLGNRFNVLALLIPFSIAFAFIPSNLYKINTFIFKFLKILLALIFLYYVLNLGNLDTTILRTLKHLMLLFTFSITTYLFHFKKKYIIVISFITTAILAYYVSDRTMIIRITLLLLSSISLSYYIKYNSKWIINILFFIFFIPGILLQHSITNNKSIIEDLVTDIDNEEYSTDTRTFLYQEVYLDLKKSSSLMTGKGANGTYFSDYFYQTQEDNSNRLSVEVGVLSIMLKSGFIGLILYLLILFSAIYLSFYKSNNYYVTGIGVMLLVYTVILFIENSIGYTLNNFIIWFFIGIALSKEMRAKSNKEVFNLLNFNKKLTYG
jgi:hypothetical protein